MAWRLLILTGLACGLVLGGCPGATAVPRNPYLSYSETYGITAGGEEDREGGGEGVTPESVFRRDLTVTFRNNSAEFEVDTLFAAWVNLSSIRSRQQQDALFRSGYVQLTEEVRLGTAFVLPVGTFVHAGPGLGGALPLRLGSTSVARVPPTRTITLVSPDALLVFSQPPVGCDSVAFRLIGGLGSPLTGPATLIGGYKTLAQVERYQCTPLRPGLFLRIVGEPAAENQYPEGGTVVFDFHDAPDDNGDFCNVTITGPGEAPQQQEP